MQTEAYQTNRNLLLTQKAKFPTKPYTVNILFYEEKRPYRASGSQVRSIADLFVGIHAGFPSQRQGAGGQYTGG